MTAQILIVDDEADLVSTVAYNLEREGFRTTRAGTGEAALALASASPAPDLVLLDLMLPDIAGTEVCRRLKQSESTRDIPVLMLTAKADQVDRVVGFELGADDYVTKPFSVRELTLRVKAILRRTEGATEPGARLRFGRLQIDVEGHRVWIDDEEIVLTALEFRLLIALAQRKGRVQTRDALLTHVWEMNGDITTRTVDTHVRRLRKKLGDVADCIETLRGVGYRFRPQPNAGD
ncbi:MAG: response regulator transcription factor [Deltaproteobacteria bacterium]|jgi:two-component system phosphate regulon response regulator PhoB|nr:response regulator transcription factor [Deltaproteobacteria bacterium]MBP7284993.1 response regulator transcription factor [Nannocystaceae bacterium]